MDVVEFNYFVVFIVLQCLHPFNARTVCNFVLHTKCGALGLPLDVTIPHDQACQGRFPQGRLPHAPYLRGAPRNYDNIFN